MINILFVDDEPNILDGFRRMLRSMRRDWQMFFAVGGAEALSLLEKQPFDVVVSDMKMPGIDGARLLGEVSERYPHIIRIILSGYSEKDMIMKSVGTTHQYLSKPCDLDVLKSTVKRVCALRDLLTGEHLRRLVSQMPTIPSLPTLYGELLAELNKTEPSSRSVAAIVKKDIGMTVKILQIVNSAFFGLQRRISDSNEAIEFLGLDTISSLALGLGIISQFEKKGAPGGLLTRLWEHSLAVGAIAKKIASEENAVIASDAFTAGLLHDIGEVVLAVNLPMQFIEAQKIVEDEKISRSEAERRIFGTTHAEVGAYLLGLWGLPTPVVEAVAYHHKPLESHSETFSALTTVHIANALRRAEQQKNQNPYFDEEYLCKLGLTEKVLNWQQNYTQ